MDRAWSGLRQGQKSIWKNLSKHSGRERTGHSRSGAWRFPKGAARCDRWEFPVVKDRIVQTALKLVIEPIFEREFEDSSYGFRPGRGCKEALREVDELIKEGYTHGGDADLDSYFDSIPKEPLMGEVSEGL